VAVKKIRKVLLVLIPVAVLILAALPNALVMHFHADPAVGGDRAIYCSYYESLPAGYGDLGPVVTVAMSVLLLILSGISREKQPGMYVYRFLGAATAAVAALVPVFFDSMTVIGWLIFGLLAAQTVLTFAGLKRD
jgi:hypothetical protein